jgi:hypothetical protein
MKVDPERVIAAIIAANPKLKVCILNSTQEK